MSNHPHHRPEANGHAAAGPPPGMEAMAAWLNQWVSFLDAVRPVPVRYNVSTVELPVMVAGAEAPTVRPFVRMVSFGMQGPHVDHLSPDLADELAGLLKRYAGEARTGLTVVSRPITPAPG